ncbi:lysosomal-trafficking regulator [Cydia strobilella]|uniref:lysosomal-trafficking regulator n=1 Tax=Cydia strobilella TaxID=1100964 RepID=UPI0030068D23
MAEEPLKLYWDHFFKAETGTYEKSTWLDLFLAEFLVRLNSGANPKELINFCPVSGVVTLVGCELLCGIHRVTSSLSAHSSPKENDVKAPVVEKEDRPTSLFTKTNSQSTGEVLRKYLLGGVAWRCLALLRALGVEGLSCCRQLSSVLIWLFGELSAGASTPTQPRPRVRRAPIHQLFSNRIWSKQKPAGSPASKINNTAVSDRSTTGRSRHVSQSKDSDVKTKRKTLKQELSSESADSNDDLQVLNRSLAIKISSPDDFEYFNSPLKSSNEYANELYGEPFHSPKKTKPKPDDYMNEKHREVINSEISAFEFILMITDLLQELCKAESSLSGSEGSQISMQCINFSLKNLCSLQFGSLPSCSKSVDEVSHIKVALTELLIVSLDKVLIRSDLCAKLINNGILPMLLRILEDVICKSSSKYHKKSDENLVDDTLTEAQSDDMLRFVFGIAYSITAFFHCLLMQCRTLDNLREFTDQFKLYGECLKGGLLRECVELMIRIRGVDYDEAFTLIKKLLESVGKLINGMKRVRSEVVHSAACPRTRHKVCRARVAAGMHHHHDILGEASTDLLLSSTCCVSVLYGTLACLLTDEEVSAQAPLRHKILRVMLNSGVCCCFSPGLLMEYIVRLMLTHDSVASKCLQVLEHTVYGDLGASVLIPKVTDQLPCSICEPSDDKRFAKKHCLHSVSPVDRKSIWSFLIHYNSLLQLDNHNNVLHATVSHLLRVTPKCRLEMKHELLFSVIYPTFIVAKHRYIIRMEDSAYFLTVSCLNIFSSLLNTVSFADQFIQKGGLSYVLELVSLPEFSNQCCSILEIAITVEIFKLIKDNTTTTYTREISSLASIQMLFKSLSGTTQRCFKIYRLKLPEEKFNELSDVAEEKKKLSFKEKRRDSSQIRKVSMPKAIKTNFAAGENVIEESIDDYLEALKNAWTFWKSCAALCLYSPVFRQYVIDEDVFLDSFALLRVLLYLVRNCDIAPAEMRLLIKIVEALLTVQFAVSDVTSDRSKEASCAVVRAALHNAGTDGSAALRALCEALVRVAVAEPSAAHAMPPPPPQAKVPPLLCPSGSSSVEGSSSEESVAVPYASEHSEPYYRADEGYEADVEIGKFDLLSTYKSRKVSESLSSTSSATEPALGPACSQYAESGRLAHPELCVIVLDILTDLIHKLVSEPDGQEGARASGASLARACCTRLAAALGRARAPPPPLLGRLLGPKTAALLELNDPDLAELQRSILELIHVVAMRSISASELALLLRLCARRAALPALLPALLRLAGDAEPAPLAVLAFPVTQSTDAGPLGRKDGFEDVSAPAHCAHAEAAARGLREAHLKAGLNSAWALHAARCGAEGAGWAPWLQGFALTTWLRRHPPNEPANEWKGSAERSLDAMEKHVNSELHVLTIGHDSLLLELWLHTDCGAFTLRLSRPETSCYKVLSETRVDAALPPAQWCCVALNVKEVVHKRKIHIQVTLYIDGCECETVSLPLQGILVRKVTPTHLLVGHSIAARGGYHMSGCCVYRAPVLGAAAALHAAAHQPAPHPHLKCKVRVVACTIYSQRTYWSVTRLRPAAAITCRGAACTARPCSAPPPRCTPPRTSPRRTRTSSASVYNSLPTHLLVGHSIAARGGYHMSGCCVYRAPVLGAAAALHAAAHQPAPHPHLKCKVRVVACTIHSQRTYWSVTLLRPAAAITCRGAACTARPCSAPPPRCTPPRTSPHRTRTSRCCVYRAPVLGAAAALHAAAHQPAPHPHLKCKVRVVACTIHSKRTYCVYNSLPTHLLVGHSIAARGGYHMSGCCVYRAPVLGAAAALHAAAHQPAPHPHLKCNVRVVACTVHSHPNAPTGRSLYCGPRRLSHVGVLRVPRARARRRRRAARRRAPARAAPAPQVQGEGCSVYNSLQTHLLVGHSIAARGGYHMSGCCVYRAPVLGATAALHAAARQPAPHPHLKCKVRVVACTVHSHPNAPTGRSLYCGPRRLSHVGVLRVPRARARRHRRAARRRAPARAAPAPQVQGEGCSVYNSLPTHLLVGHSIAARGGYHMSGCCVYRAPVLGAAAALHAAAHQPAPHPHLKCKFTPIPTHLLVGHSIAARGGYHMSGCCVYRAPVLGAAAALHAAAHQPAPHPHLKCKVDNEIPNYSRLLTPNVLDSNIDWDHVYDMSGAALRELNENLLLSFSAHAPNIVNLYHQTTPLSTVFSTRNPGPKPVAGACVPEPLACTWTVRWKASGHCGIAPAVYMLGGPSVLLYLFARVVEMEASAEEQGMALGIVLRVCRADNRLRSALHGADGLELLLRVFGTPKCRLTRRMLQVKTEEQAMALGIVLRVCRADNRLRSALHGADGLELLLRVFGTPKCRLTRRMLQVKTEEQAMALGIVLRVCRADNRLRSALHGADGLELLLRVFGTPKCRLTRRMLQVKTEEQAMALGIVLRVCRADKRLRSALHGADGLELLLRVFGTPKCRLTRRMLQVKTEEQAMALGIVLRVCRADNRLRSALHGADGLELLLRVFGTPKCRLTRRMLQVKTEEQAMALGIVLRVCRADNRLRSALHGADGLELLLRVFGTPKCRLTRRMLQVKTEEQAMALGIVLRVCRADNRLRSALHGADGLELLLRVFGTPKCRLTRRMLQVKTEEQAMALGIVLRVCRADNRLRSALHGADGLELLLRVFGTPKCRLTRRMLQVKTEEQAMTLGIVLRVCRADNRLRSALHGADGLELLLRVFGTPKCRLTRRMLQVILEEACTSRVLTSTGAGLVVSGADAVVREPALLALLVQASRHLDTKEELEWEVEGERMRGSLWALTLCCIRSLLEDAGARRWRAFNQQQLHRHHLLRLLLAACKERFLNSEDNPSRSPDAAGACLVGVVGGLLGSPPLPCHLAELCDFLLLMHQASDTFVTHSRANFYFLLTADTQDTSEFMMKARRREPEPEATDSGSLREEDSKLMKGIINMQIKEGRKHNISSTSENSDLNIEMSGDMMDPVVENESVPDDALSGYIVVDVDDVAHTTVEMYSSGIYHEKRVRAGAAPGWTACEGLLLLLRDAILLLSEHDLAQAMQGAIQPEALIVVANHRDAGVRAAVLRVVGALQRRGVPALQPRVPHKTYLYRHLANQIALYPSSIELAAACAALVTKCDVPLEDQLEDDIWVDVSPEMLHCAAPLLATLPTCLHDPPLAHNVSLLVRRIIDKGSLKLLSEMSIAEVAVRCVRDLGATGEFNGRALLLSDMGALLAKLAVKALESHHHMQIITDMHHMLTYAELTAESENVARAARAAQVSLFVAQLDHLDIASRARQKHNNYFTNVLSSAVSLGTEGISQTELEARQLATVTASVNFLQSRSPVLPVHSEGELVERLLVMLIAAVSGGLPTRRAWWAGSGGDGWLRALRELVWWVGAPASGARALQPHLLRALHAAPHVATMLKPPPTCRKLAVYLLLMLRHMHALAENGDEGVELAITDWARGWCVALQDGLENRLGAALQDEAAALLRVDEERWTKTAHNHNANIGKVIFSKESLAARLTESAMAATRAVVDVQNGERKAFMEVLRRSQSSGAVATRCWQQLADHLTHEQALWHEPESYPVSWELDGAEAPGRVRVRLRRAHLALKPRFLKPSHQHKPVLAEAAACSTVHLRSITGDAGGFRGGLVARLQLHETVAHMARVTLVTVARERDGELLLTDRCIHFVPDSLGDVEGEEALSWALEDVRHVATRRWCLQERAAELFLAEGRAWLLAFAGNAERTAFLQHTAKHLPTRMEPETLSEAMNQWRNGTITNWEYLMKLNGLAGRTYNDLMQYPVLPFVIADYSSRILDLNDPATFRDLSKPMAIQNKSREQHYINTYNDLKAARREGCGALASRDPHHYASLYSNPGCVLHYLVRLPPFTQLLLHYQDNNFDMPDRTFHSLATTWRLITNDSPTDVKELIPELYYLPELFHNDEGLNLGVRQCGACVDDVELPAWAADARLFTLVHRQALEAPLVTESLPHWIDLVFGYKQTGQAAIDAVNVFPHCTYYGFDPETLSDEVDRTAAAAMVRTYGQAPRQLLRAPHPHRASDLAPTTDRQPQVWAGVEGARWGRYCGSPSLGAPRVALRRALGGARLAPLPERAHAAAAAAAPPHNALLALPADHGDVSTNSSGETCLALLSWGHSDGVVRLKRRRDAPLEPVLRVTPLDQITAVATSCTSASCPVVIGHASGRVLVLRPRRGGGAALRARSLALHAHDAHVTDVAVCVPAGLLVTASVDGKIVLWDLNKLTYIRTLPNRDMLPVTHVAISETLCDVASVHDVTAPTTSTPTADDDSYEKDAENYKSLIRVHTVNGRFVGSVKVAERVTCICYSNAPEGVSVNAIACGDRSGAVRFYSAWDLRPLGVLPAAHTAPAALGVVSLTYSLDSEILFGCYADGTCVAWHGGGARPTVQLLPAHALF